MSARWQHVRFVSAGAGSGKTYRLTEELERALVEDGVEPSRVLGTTFTVKAAAELKERVRERLIANGRPQLSAELAQAMVGTVHSVCERLLKRFAFELGLSPEMNVASLEDASELLGRALDEVLDSRTVRTMNSLSARLDMYSSYGNDARTWRDDVESLVRQARDNDIGSRALAGMGRDSASTLLEFFPEAQATDWDQDLLDAVRDAIHAIEGGGDTTAGTARYLQTLKAAIYELRRPPCAWSQWIKLSKSKATKKSEPIAARVRAAASAFACHPLLHADIRGYIEGVFEIAAGALERFQALKTERGLIDFSDMERLTLHALDHPEIEAQLGAELALVLVDEFQDTNPMQLAIFMRLAALAERVIFVGDVKQAIYAFRGCDPDLVFKTLAAIASSGGSEDVLAHSWRSRPALVHYINAVFTQAFDGEIAPEQITLAPVRVECTESPAVLAWHIAGSVEARAAALADGIADLVASGYQVVDPDSGRVRAITWSDIAVLAATNPHVEALAKALRAAQVPMKMTLRGLLTVPEVCLARACLRRLNDRSDTLATAEILAMADCTEPEAWLDARLDALARGVDSYAWAEDSHPIVGKLKELRAQSTTQSPVEIVARVLNYVGVREIVTAWGPSAIKAAQRQRNLDALLNLAVEYERHAHAQHAAATLTGFLFWLENPHSAELDVQPVVTTGDAVHVATYHRAKGLEWPVVVATDFHYEWRARLWEPRVESDAATFDVERPLEERHIRFWPPVFGGRSRDIPVLDAIVASAEGERCRRKARAENRRLAYVGLTRARDALVLALPTQNPKSDAWLHAFDSEYLVPQGETLTLPDGTSIAARSIELAPEGGASPKLFQPRWLPARRPLEAAERETLYPSSAPPDPNAQVVETVTFDARVRLSGNDMPAIGSALHAVIAAELVNPGGRDAAHRVRALLEGYGVGSYVSADDALGAARRFRHWVTTRFAPTRVLAEWPISERLENGRQLRGTIDVLLETAQGWIVIDHKSSPRPRAEWPDELAEYAGQLARYRRALFAAGHPVAECWLHFPVGGGAVRATPPTID